jgi:ketosteroid isomerase-like protein
MKSNITALLFTLLVFSINSRAQSKPNANLEEAKKTIAESNAIHFKLYLKNDGSIMKLYTDDACLLQPNAPALCGYEQVSKFFKDAYNAGGVRDGKIITLNIYGEGNEYVTEEGLWQIFDGTGKMLDDGKYLAIWKKTKDGWKMFRDMPSSNHPPK